MGNDVVRPWFVYTTNSAKLKKEGRIGQIHCVNVRNKCFENSSHFSCDVDTSTSARESVRNGKFFFYPQFLFLNKINLSLASTRKRASGNIRKMILQ